MIMHQSQYANLRILECLINASLLNFFLKDFLDKVLKSLGISFQVENLKKFFCCTRSLEFLT